MVSIVWVLSCLFVEVFLLSKDGGLVFGRYFIISVFIEGVDVLSINFGVVLILLFE